MFQNLWHAIVACLPFFVGVYAISAIIVFVVAAWFTVEEVREDRVLTLAAVFLVLVISFTPVLNTFLVFLPLLSFLNERFDEPLERLHRRLDAIHLFRLSGHRLTAGPTPLPPVPRPQAASPDPWKDVSMDVGSAPRAPAWDSGIPKPGTAVGEG